MSGNGKKNGRHRPHGLDRLTKEQRDNLERVFAAGGTVQVAADFIGVDRTTLHRWYAKGERDCEEGTHSKERNFYDMVRGARSRASVRALATIQRVITGTEKQLGDGRLALEYLARTDPENWSEKVEVKNPGGLPAGMPEVLKIIVEKET